MLLPLRVYGRIRPSVSIGVVLAAAVEASLLAATPLLIPRVSDAHGLSTGVAGLLSTAQMSGFLVATLIASRRMTPSARILRIALCIAGVATLASAVAPSFGVLLILTLIAGSASGLCVWVVWQEAVGTERSVGDVTVIGPLVAAVAAPVLGAVIATGGLRLTYVLLGLFCLVPLLAEIRIGLPKTPGREGHHPPVAAAMALLVGFFFFTLGGSAVFVFVVMLGSSRNGLSLTAIAVVLSLNSIAGVPAARRACCARLPGLYVAGTGLCALLVAVSFDSTVFVAALVIWGYLFWRATPSALLLLVEHSRFPQERVGDAHGAMAAGRVLGPVLGGAVMGTGSTMMLGLIGGGLIATAATIMLTIEIRSDSPRRRGDRVSLDPLSSDRGAARLQPS